MSDAPYHAHIYYSEEQGPAARALRDRFIGAQPRVLYVGGMTDRAVGPHPIPQFEVHFREGNLPEVLTAIEDSGLRARHRLQRSGSHKAIRSARPGRRRR